MYFSYSRTFESPAGKSSWLNAMEFFDSERYGAVWNLPDQWSVQLPYGDELSWRQLHWSWVFSIYGQLERKSSLQMLLPVLSSKVSIAYTLLLFFLVWSQTEDAFWMRLTDWKMRLGHATSSNQDITRLSPSDQSRTTEVLNYLHAQLELCFQYTFFICHFLLHLSLHCFLRAGEWISWTCRINFQLRSSMREITPLFILAMRWSGANKLGW